MIEMIKNRKQDKPHQAETILTYRIFYNNDTLVVKA